MRFYTFSLIRIIVSGLLSCTLITNSMATEKSEKLIPKDVLTQIANSMNLEKMSLKDYLTKLQKTDSVKANELDSYLITHPEMNSVQLPKVRVENDKLVFIFDGQKSSMSLKENGDMEIALNDEVIPLKTTMTVDQIAKKISETIKSKKEFSLLSFFIQDSYAVIFLAAVAVYVIIFAALLAIFKLRDYLINRPAELDKADLEKVESIKKIAAQMEKTCRDYDNYLGEGDDVSDLGVMYNKLTELNITYCKLGPFKRNTYNEEVCDTLIPKIKKCFKEKVDLQNKHFVENSLRTNYKQKLSLDKGTDTFMYKGESR